MVPSVYFSFFCLLVSSVSNFCPDKSGAVVVTFFRLACSVVLWGGRNTANKYHWCVLTVIQPHWVCPRSRSVCFPCLHCSGFRLLCRELSDAGPGLHALPRSKPLRFRFSTKYSTKVQTWLGLCFVPFPGSSSSGDQVLGEHSHRQVGGASYRLLRPSCSVFCVYNRCAFSGVPCVSSGELISGCDPPGGCQLSRIPRSLG